MIIAATGILGNINWLGFMASIVYWIGYALIGVAVLAIFYLIYYMFSFKFKVMEIPVIGSGNDRSYSVGKFRSNKFKWNKKKTAWKALKPWFNKKEIEPFDSKYIYHGNTVYSFKMGEEHIPGCASITEDEDNNLITQINPVPYYIRNWQSLKHKEHAIEFAKHDWWSQNKGLMYVLIISGACLLMVGVTVYFTYQFATGGASQMSALTEAIKGMGENVIR